MDLRWGIELLSNLALAHLASPMYSPCTVQYFCLFVLMGDFAANLVLFVLIFVRTHCRVDCGSLAQ
jgi:hypothetical protein